MIWLPGHEIAYSPLLKIPLLVTSTALGHVALTPPTPAASKEEQAKYKGGQDLLGHWSLLRVAGVCYKTIYWTNVVAESAVILSTQLPATFGSGLLSFLVRSPLRRAENVRITPFWLAGCALMAGGSLIRLSCYRALGEFFTWQLTVKKGQKLVTTGPYAVVRHPAYLGSWLIGLGTVVMHFSPGGWFYECLGTDTIASKAFIAFWSAWMLSVPVILSKRTKVEDEALKEVFGEEWEAYARKTWYRLIPFVY